MKIADILCLLVSHGMMGFIDGEFLSPDQPDEGKKKKKDGDIEAWIKSNALVKGWILGSLSEQTLSHVVNVPNKNSSDFTAKEVWDELRTLYGAPLPQQPPAPDIVNKEEERKTRETQPTGQQNLITQSEKSTDEEKKKQETEEEENRYKAAAIEKVHQSLYEATLRQSFEDVEDILKKNETLKVSTKITINGNTALHVAVGTTKNMEFIKKMFTLVKEKGELLEKNADGSTLLHVAAIVGNTEAAKMLVEKETDLLFDVDKDGRVPLFKAHSNMHTDTYLYLLEHDDHNPHDLEMGTIGDELMYNAITSQDYHSAIRLIDKYPNLHRGYVLMAIAQNFPRKLTIWETILHKFGRNPDEKKATAMKKILGFFSIIYEILLIIPRLLFIILLVAISLGIPAAFIYGQVVFWKKNKGSKRWFLILINIGGQVAITLLYHAVIKITECLIHLARWLRRKMHKFTSFIAKFPLLGRMLCRRTQKQTSCTATSWLSMPSLSVFKK